MDSDGKRQILIVEDDEITALNLNMSLQKHGYHVVQMCSDAESAKAYLKSHTPHIVIIDISLQESSDGIKLAKHVKAQYAIPFIFLTSYSDDDIITQAKFTEPYGYIVKPFDPSSLHATIQMALFRYDVENQRIEELNTPKLEQIDLERMLHERQSSEKPIVLFGDDYFLDLVACETFYKGKKIKLTKKENAFLRLLVAKLGHVVTFDQAISYVWEDHGATENSVRTLVWRLRNKLQTDVIKNASGMGYYIED
ncbi:MAG: response regulator [Epsilonproteobacteria bacterium]|nr:response regulator [Campylobacterota bacterium]